MATGFITEPIHNDNTFVLAQFIKHVGRGIIIIIIIISLFNEDDILSYRLSNIWSSTMKLVQICLKTYIQYNKYTLFTF